jgi:peptidoglycan/xylan/chitin deacetylase (PgdA/CDA1 family)
MLIHHCCEWAMQAFGRRKLSILIYHQVLAEPDAMRPADDMVEDFRWQMQLLRDFFQPLSLSEAVARLRDNSLPAKAVCVTFDDGYLNNLELAEPVLTEFLIPATVFVAPGFSDGTNMWNDRLIDLVGQSSLEHLDLSAVDMGTVPLAGYEQRIALAEELIEKIKYTPMQQRHELVSTLYRENRTEELSARMMNPEQIRELASRGVDIGAHTMDHPILKTLPIEEQISQIGRSKDTLEHWLDKPIKGFAYPNGKPDQDYDQHTVEAVKDLGFDYAVSTAWGTNSDFSSRYELKRFSPWDTTPGKYHLRLTRNVLGF